MGYIKNFNAIIPIVMDGRKTWADNTTISKAIEIDRGVILNQEIISYQNRHQEYPHPIL